MKKATVDNLLKLKAKSDSNSIGTIKLDKLGLEFDYIKMPIMAVLELMGEYGDDTKGQLDMTMELIYMTIPLFRDKQLQEQIKCAEPHEIVLRALGDNLSAVTELGTEVIKLYNLDNTIDEVKK